MPQELSFEQLPALVANLGRKVDDLTALIQARSQPEPDQWFNVSQLREYLPDKPAEATVYGWVQANAIPHGRNSKTLIFLKADIDFWLLSKRRKTSAEVEGQAVELLSTRRRGGRKAA